MELQTHGAAKYPNSALLRSSAGLGWSTLSAELRSHEASETPTIVPEHVEICFVVTGNDECVVRRTTGGQSMQVRATTGTVCLSPIGVGDNSVTITAPVARAMHLYLPVTLFRRLSDDFNLPQLPAHSIRSVAGSRDDVISSTALSILSEMADETAAGRMYVEAASLTLAARILRRYRDGADFSVVTPFSQQLDDGRMHRVVDYISENIAGEITLAELARVAALSPFHFARMFTRAFGISPHRYVSRIRLENAMAEIAAGKLPLAQIAFNARFSSQASFTRAFHRATGMTPAEYRRSRR